MLLVITAAVVAGVWFAFLRASGAARRAAPSRGALLIVPARRRALPRLSGSSLTPPPPRLSLFASDGRPTFIDVWASWCVPCNEEAPMLASLDRSYGGRIRFLGIDVEDTRDAARAFERKYDIRYPSIFDQRASMATKLGFFGLPTAYFVDRRGRLAAIRIGKQTRAAIENRLQLLVREQSGRR